METRFTAIDRLVGVFVAAVAAIVFLTHILGMFFGVGLMSLSWTMHSGPGYSILTVWTFIAIFICLGLLQVVAGFCLIRGGKHGLSLALVLGAVSWFAGDIFSFMAIALVLYTGARLSGILGPKPE